MNFSPTPKPICSPQRWTLPESPLDYFRAHGQDYFACPSGLFQMSQTDESDFDMMEAMEQDSEDMFAVSDIGM